MPLETNERLAPKDKHELASALSQACSEILGKPERYVMAIVIDELAMTHAGERGPAAFLDVRSIGGLSSATNKKLSARLCELVSSAARISKDRIYLNFSDVAASDWGHDGGTFG
jgi:phenylpyruvate tautomerase